MNVPLREGFVLNQPPQPGAPRSVNAEPIAPGIPPSPGPQPPEIEPSPAEKPEIQSIDEWPKRVKILHRKVANDRGELVEEIKLREPRAADINRWGNPCRLSNEGEILMDERKMTYMISALSGLLPQTIELMDTRDWNSVAYRLRPFFLPELEAWL
jgi:hypothetical protein